MGKEKNTDRSRAQPLALYGGCSSSKVLGCSPNWVVQTGEAGTAIGPGWLAHIKVGPKVRGSEVAKKSQCVPKPTNIKKRIPQMGNPPTLSPWGPLGSKILSSSIVKGLEKTFQSKWSVRIVAKPMKRKSRTTDAQTHSPHPSWAQPNRSSWVN